MCDYDDKFHITKKRAFISNFSKIESSIPDSIKCSEKFLSLNLVDKDSDDDLLCKQCHIRYDDFQSAVSHRCMPYKCKLCNTAFLFDFELKMHKCIKKKSDKTETNESSTFVGFSSSSSPESSLSFNSEVISSKKRVKNCDQCGKKLSFRCRGMLCGNCKNEAHKDRKSAHKYKGLYKNMSSPYLSELSSNDGADNSSKRPDQLKACSELKKISDKYKDSTTPCDDRIPFPLNLPQTKIHLNMSEKIQKNNDSNRGKGKKRGALRKCPNGTATSDMDGIESQNPYAKKRKKVSTNGKVKKKTVSDELGNGCFRSASESSNCTRSNNQTPESYNLAVDCQDELDGYSSNHHMCKKLKISEPSTSLSKNSLVTNENSTSEMLNSSAKCNEFDNIPAEVGDITVSGDISCDPGHESEILPTGGIKVNIDNRYSKEKKFSNLENEPLQIESGYSERTTSCDNSCNNIPETSNLISNGKEIDSSNKHLENNNSSDYADVPFAVAESSGISSEQINHLSNRSNSIHKKKKLVSTKKSKNHLNRLKPLSLEGKAIAINNSGKNLECDNSEKLVGENNVLIASLESKDKATKKRLSLNTVCFKGQTSDFKDNAVKFRHKKFSRKHNPSIEASTNLSLSQGNHKQNSSEKNKSCVTLDNSRCHEVNLETTIQDKSGKSKKQIFLSKITSEGTCVAENSMSTSVNLCSTASKGSTVSKKLKIGHSNLSSPKSRCANDKTIEKNRKIHELNSSKSTVNSDDKQNNQHCSRREIEENKRKANSNLQFIALGSLIKALPDYGVIVMKESAAGCNTFKCPTCNYIFKYIKRAADHYSTCPFRGKKDKEPKLLSDVEFVCASCYQHWSSIHELYRHKKCSMNNYENLAQDSGIPIGNYIHHYEHSKKKVCPKCGFSCLSLHIFSRHPCEKRLETMKTCVVAIPKLSDHDLSAFDGLSKFECPSCNQIFFDSATFQNHTKVHANINLNTEKPSVHSNKAFIKQEIKKLITASGDCHSVEEMKKRVLEPIYEICAHYTENAYPNLGLNVSMSYSQQKLFGEAAKRILSENVDLDDIAKNLKGFIMSDSDDDDDTSKDEDSSITDAFDSAFLRDYLCKCPNSSGHPKGESKPCLKCLNIFMRSKIDDNSGLDQGSSVVRNRDSGMTALGSSSAAGPSCSYSNDAAVPSCSYSNDAAVPSCSYSNDEAVPSCSYSNDEAVPSCSYSNDEAVPSCSYSNRTMLASGSVTSVADRSNISNEAHDTVFPVPEKDASQLSEVPLNNGNSLPVPSSPAENVASVVAIASLHQTTSDNISTEQSVTPTSLIGEWNSLKQLLPDCLKVLCYISDSDTLDVNKETFSGTKLPPKIKETLLSCYGPVTIYKEIEGVMRDIRLESKSDKVTLFVDIVSNNCSDSVDKIKKISFLEMLLDISHPVTLASPLILAKREILTSVHTEDLNCKNKVPSPNSLEQARTSEHDDIRGKQSKCSQHIYFWEFEEIMRFLLSHENDFSVTFDVLLPFSIKLIVDWSFDEKVVYSVYASKNPEAYLCATCVSSIPLSKLLEHVISEHEDETYIHILIM